MDGPSNNAVDEESSGTSILKDNSNDNNKNNSNDNNNDDYNAVLSDVSNNRQPEDSRITTDNNNANNNQHADNNDYKNGFNSDQTRLVSPASNSNSGVTTTITTTAMIGDHDYQSTGTAGIVNPNTDNPFVDQPDTEICERSDDHDDTINASLKAGRVGSQELGHKDEEGFVRGEDFGSKEVNKESSACDDIIGPKEANTESSVCEDLRSKEESLELKVGEENRGGEKFDFDCDSGKGKEKKNSNADVFSKDNLDDCEKKRESVDNVKEDHHLADSVVNCGDEDSSKNEGNNCGRVTFCDSGTLKGNENGEECEEKSVNKENELKHCEEKERQFSVSSLDSDVISNFVSEITNKALTSYRDQIAQEHRDKGKHLEADQSEVNLNKEKEQGGESNNVDGKENKIVDNERVKDGDSSTNREEDRRDTVQENGSGENVIATHSSNTHDLNSEQDNITEEDSNFQHENRSNTQEKHVIEDGTNTSDRIEPDQKDEHQRPVDQDSLTDDHNPLESTRPVDDQNFPDIIICQPSDKEDPTDSLSSSPLPLSPSPPLTSSPTNMDDQNRRPIPRPKSSHHRRRGQQDTDHPRTTTPNDQDSDKSIHASTPSPSTRSQSPNNTRSPSPNIRSASPIKRSSSPAKRTPSPSIRSPSPGELSINISGHSVDKNHKEYGDSNKESDDGMREQIFHIENVPQGTKNDIASSPSSNKDEDISVTGSGPASPRSVRTDYDDVGGRHSSRTYNKSPCNDRLSRIADAADNIAGMQDNLQYMFREAKEVLTHYQSQLHNQSIVEFSQDVPEFNQAFSSLSDAYRVCENVTGNIDQQLNDIRTATSEICDLITHKATCEDLADFMQNKDSNEGDDADSIEKKASYKEQQARLQELKAITAKAAAQAQTAYELAAQAEVKATEADVAATNARKEAEIAMKKLEDARIAAETKRRNDEEEARRVAEEIARKKEMEEKRRKEEEMRIAREAESRGTSKEEERRRYLEEKKRLEAERKNPNNWPRYIYSIDGGDWNPGVGVILRAQQGCLDRDDLEITLLDQMDSCFPLGENEELISNIVCLRPVDSEKSYQFEEPMSVSIPHCSPRIPPGREPVVKLMSLEGKMSTLSTHDLIFDDIKELKFAEVRLRQFGTMAVFLRSKKEQLTLNKMGGKVISSVDSRVTITSCENAFRTNATFTMEVQPIDQNIILELRAKKPDPCGNLMASSPIVTVQMTTKFHKPLTMTLPCPPNPALRPRRPQTATVRLAPTPPKEKQDPIDRPLSARMFQTKEEPETDELHLLRQDGGGLWTKADDVTLTHTKKKDIVSFDLANPFKKLVLIRTKTGLTNGLVEKILGHVITALTFKPVSVIMRQKTNDPNRVTVTCTQSGNVERVIKSLAEEGYDHGPKPSPDILLTEGQRLTLRFRGNLVLTDDEFSRTDFKFCNHIPFRLNFAVNEQDKYAQKGFDSYRGFSQIFTKGKIRRPSMAVDDRDRATGQKVKDEFVDGDILVCEHLVIIPKPDPETPRPLNVTPVSLTSEGIVNDEMLRFLSTHLQNNDWKRLASQLNVKRSRIQAILRQNLNNSTNQTVYDILVTWSKRLPRAINRTDILCKNLSSIGRDDLAEELRVRDEEYRQAKHLKARESYLRKAFVAIVRNPLVVAQWKHLARYLEVEEDDIQRIESTHDNCQESCLATLIRWKDVRGEEATIPLLANKLRRCRYRRLAREVEDIR